MSDKDEIKEKEAPVEKKESVETTAKTKKPIKEEKTEEEETKESSENEEESLEEKIEEGINMNRIVLEKMVAESVKSKIEVVKKDEEEQGERKTLNFGHTFAHAFEKLYKISHGEAVAVGMVLAAQMSVNLRMLEHSKAEQLKALILRSGLPVSLDFDVEAVSNAMKKDKKRAGGEIRFILLEDIGKSVIKNISLNDIKSILYDLR